VYVHFINKPAPPLTFEELDRQRAAAGPSSTTPAAAAAVTSAAAGTGADTISGTWNVVQPSSAGYRVKEVLNGQSTEAVGRTTTVEGTVVISGTTVTEAQLSVDLSTVSSDSSRRDAQFRGRIMNTAEFPVAIFDLDQPIELGSLPGEGPQVSVTATGTLSLHGTDRSVQVAITARRSSTGIELTGSAPIVFADFGIDPPGVGGFVTTDDNGVLEFALTLQRS
jgi:polyisoprenoid-binding protein YceI